MQAPTKIAVAGATGRAGHHVVDVLKARGHEVVPISRSGGVDLITGEGLAAALTGVACIVDAASTPSADEQEATAYFTTAGRNLQEFGARAGVQRIVAVSIIGTDRFSSGYGAAKVAHERTLQSGPVPVRILRAAQFHELVPQLLEWGRQGDVCYVQQMRTQLVAARSVAEAAADLSIEPETTTAPGWQGGPFVEVAGPREESLVEMAKLYVARRGEPVRIEGVSDPADPNRENYETGGLLPGPDAILAGPTFAEWLDAAS